MKTREFAEKYLFTPLGISEIDWEQSPQGIDVGYGRMWLNPQEMAKIGWFYLNKGRWGKQQLVSSSWVENSTRGHIEAKPGLKYGYQWWVDDEGNYSAIGYSGQYIMVAPGMNMVVVFTGALPGGKTSLPFELAKKYIFPAIVSFESLPVNLREAEKLDTLVRSISIPFQDGVIWFSKEEGMAKNGVFRRTKRPKFMFEYPIGSKKQGVTSPGQIMRMNIPKRVNFTANVIIKPEKLDLKDFGPVHYAEILRQVGSDVRVVGNKEIGLKCGTNTYRTDIKWVYQDYYQLNSVLVSSYKNDQCVYLAVHPSSLANHDNFERIVESLTFE